MARIQIIGLLLGIVAAASVGCQEKPQFAPVEGTVTKGGKPLAGAIVDFYPEPNNCGPRSTSAATDATGHYRLRGTGGGEDGAVVGQHRVCIVDIGDPPRNLFLERLSKRGMLPKEGREKMKGVKGTAPAPSRVPPSYGRPDETPLRAEVGPNSQTLDFDLP